MNRQVRILVSGRVQGVYFRAFTQKQANRLGVRGFARNLADGRVEVIAIGTGEAVEKLIQWCHKGPITAKVEQVVVEPIATEALPPAEFPADFEIR